jgi:hypothetical protein
MNDIDQEVRRHLRELIDPEPVDTDRALRVVSTSRLAHGEATRARIPLVALSAVAAIAVTLTVALVTTRDRLAAPPYRLMGAAGANVVVEIRSSDGQAPTATLSVGNSVVPGTEIPGTSTSDGISFSPGFTLPSGPLVDVPDGSTLLVEGTFETARASALWWVVSGSDETGDRVVQVGTWQLDSSGGSVVFTGRDGNRVYLVVQAEIGSEEHIFMFPMRIVQTGG